MSDKEQILNVFFFRTCKEGNNYSESSVMTGILLGPSSRTVIGQKFLMMGQPVSIHIIRLRMNVGT